MRLFFGLSDDPLEELEQNLRAHLGIAGAIEATEAMDAFEALGVTFALNEDASVDVEATRTEITVIRLWASSMKKRASSST